MTFLRAGYSFECPEPLDTIQSAKQQVNAAADPSLRRRYFLSYVFNHQSTTHSQATQAPLINKVSDNKLTDGLINNQRITA